jgi:hypothetical protein
MDKMTFTQHRLGKELLNTIRVPSDIGWNPNIDQRQTKTVDYWGEWAVRKQNGQRAQRLHSYPDSPDQTIKL